MRNEAEQFLVPDSSFLIFIKVKLPDKTKR